MLNVGFIKNYDKGSDKGYILEVDIEYPRNLHDLHSDLPFFPIELKLINAANLHASCIIRAVVHIKALKRPLNHGLVLTKVHKVIKFN